MIFTATGTTARRRDRPAHPAGSLRLRWTLADPARAGAQVDVEVQAAPGEPLAALRPALLAALGLGGPGAPDVVYADGAALGELTPVGLPPLLDGAVLTVGRPGVAAGTAAGTATALLELQVIAGPGAGRRIPLPPGRHRLGRAPDAGVRLEDPDVSRAHAELSVGPGGVGVRDLGSTNGTEVDGHPVQSGELPLPLGALLRVGRTILALHTGRGPGLGPAAAAPDGRGHLLVNRTPRLLPPLTPARVEFPAPPRAADRSGLPWAAVLLPLVVSVPAALIWHQPTFLLLAALSPLAAVGQYLSERLSRGRRYRGALLAHARDLESARHALDEALRQEAAQRRREHPHLALVAATAAGPLEGLWQRRHDDPDALTVRLGLGRLPARALVDHPSGGDGHAPGAAEGPLEVDAVPVTLDLRRSPVVGLAGPREELLAVAGAVIAQLATWRSPAELEISLLSAADGSTQDWSWVAWLPHLRQAPPDLDAGTTGVTPDAFAGPEPVDGLGPPGPYRQAVAPHQLVVLDGAARLRRDPAVARLLAHGQAGRLSCLCLDADTTRLPAECRSTVVLDGGRATLRTRGEEALSLAADLPSPAWATRLARDLAPLRDATPATGPAALPPSVRLLDLLADSGPEGGVDAADPKDIARHWAAASPCPATVLGVTATGGWTIDLRRDGPHVLIGGTTGAGKSELLLGLVAGLAVSNRPDELAFLLVDYKGGAAFGRLAGLPHVTGVLTDLDAGTARRALAGLHAEVRRRERVLRACGAADHASYPGAPSALPRLVILVDEFRVLADEAPELLDGLVRVAAVGRSLGIHLVLATQRPGGAVSADMRANVNLRIALRVRDRSESEDLIEAPDAAALPAGLPGRGVARCGGGPALHVQAARVTAGAGERGREPVRSLLRDPAAPGVLRPQITPTTPTAPTAPTGPTGAGPSCDLDLVVAAVSAATTRLRITPPPPPWAPPLPAASARTDLAGLELLGDPIAPLRYALADLPERQCRAALSWDLAAGTHLAVVGAPGSGRTGLLAALARAAQEDSRSRGPRPVHVHAVDGRGALTRIEGWAAVGTVCAATDLERCERLLDLIAAQLEGHLSGGAGGGPADAGSGHPPWTVLLVDGWEEVRETWEAAGNGRLLEALLRLARDGGPAGVRLAVTGGRGLLTGEPGALLGERVMLRSHDPMDLVLAGVPADLVPTAMPPGRLLRRGADGATVLGQVVQDPPPTGTQRRGGPAGPTPPRLPVLPRHVRLADLLPADPIRARQPGATAGVRRDPDPSRDGDPPSPVIGIATVTGQTRLPRPVPTGQGADAAGPGGLEPALLDLRTPPGALVVGGPGSGRSTALEVIARSALASGHHVIALADPHSPLARSAVAGARLLGFETSAAALLAALATTPTAALVLVDEAHRIEGTDLEAVLLGELGTGWGDGSGGRAATTPGAARGGPGPRVVAAVAAAEAAVAFRGLVAALRSTRTGLVLGAGGPTENEVFRTQLPARRPGAPGRGLLVRAGRVRTVQVADPAGG